MVKAFLLFHLIEGGRDRDRDRERTNSFIMAQFSSMRWSLHGLITSPRPHPHS